MLKREQEIEIAAIDKNYTSLISRSQEQFKFYTLIVIPKLQVLIKRFKLDINKLLNTSCVDM